jgi:hypothetical protein
LKDLDSAALTYAEVKAIASGNPLVIEKAQVDADIGELKTQLDVPFEHQEKLESAEKRQQEIIAALDLSKNQASTQVDEQA